jgi:hypothetical protein
MPMPRSKNPTFLQQVRYWRIDHDIRIQILDKTIHGFARFVPLRKRGQRLCKPMTWREIVAYVDGCVAKPKEAT